MGAGIRDSGVPRAKIFLTSKLWNNKHHPDDVEKALDESLERLGTDYLDLYLMHMPVAFARGKELIPRDKEGRAILSDIPITDTWKAMEVLTVNTTYCRHEDPTERLVVV